MVAYDVLSLIRGKSADCRQPSGVATRRILIPLIDGITHTRDLFSTNRDQKPTHQEGYKMTDTVRGAAIKGVTRPSRRFNTGRVCAKGGCDTRLSQYNKAEYCHAHAPIRFPRVRGKIMDEQDA
jgi:hypothetical protein